MARFNLIYHICPFPNAMLERNLELLAAHSGLFNHKVIVNIATGEGLIPASMVEAYLRQHLQCKVPTFLHTPNADNREVSVLFDRLLPQIASTDEEEYTFFAHSKGVTMPENRNVQQWVEWLYKFNLGDIAKLQRGLPQTHCAGCFRMLGSLPGEGRVPWHFSGTFFWLNHRHIFANDSWLYPQRGRWAAEAWLGRSVPYKNSWCIFGEGSGNFYTDTAVRRFRGQLENSRRQHRPLRRKGGSLENATHG